MRFLSVRKC